MQAEVDRAKAEAVEARAAADAALHEKDKRIEALEKQLAELRAAMN